MMISTLGKGAKTHWNISLNEMNLYVYYISSYFNTRNIHITQQLFQITIWTSLQVSTESQNLPFLYCLCTNTHIHTHIWFFHYIDHIHFNFCTHIFTLLSAQKSKIAKLWKQNKINKQIGHQFRKKIYIYTYCI